MNQSFLLASNVVGIVIAAVIALVVGGAIGFVLNKFLVTNKINKSKATASRIVQDALNEAKTMKKEAILEAKEEAHKLKVDCDNELRDRRFEVQKIEDRIIQKEEAIDRKQELIDNEKLEIEKFKENLKKQEEETLQKQNEIIVKLEKVAGLTKQQAKEELIESITDEAKKDAANIFRSIVNEAKENADKEAKEIITMAIQRSAADYTSEATISVVSLPNNEVKGRIIGREGRNIRALEAATGVDLIIDDTPEAITVSSFDPIRREIARISLEKLILDGRIHPGRIEEIVEKVKRDLEATMKEAGENAVIEAGIQGLHPELVKVLGRLKYRTSYGQNVLTHSIEIAKLAGAMAAEIGANVEIAKRGGLLHDIGKALDFEMEGTHVSLGVDLCKKYKENASVINCIEAHHGDVEFKCLEAYLVQAGDAISSSRPGARRESLETYIKRLQKLEEVANSFKGVDKAYAIQAGREIRILVKPEEITDDEALFLAKEVAKKIESEMEYPGQIKVNVIRETRASEYAK